MAAGSVGRHALGLAVVLLGSASAPVAATDRPAVAFADDVLAASLADHVQAGVTVDLDEDGDREILVIVNDGSGPRLAAWREARGEWQPAGTRPVAAFATGGHEVRPLTVGSGLVLVRDGTRERPILATTPSLGTQQTPCCLSLFEVLLGSNGLELRPIGEHLGLAWSIAAADLDADGRDELVITAPVDPTGPEPAFEDVRILRWVGGALGAEPVAVPEDAGLLAAIGDSDGIPGADLHFLVGRELTRIAVGADRRLRTETTTLPSATRREAGWIAGATAGVVVTVDGIGRVATFRWPRDGAASRTASLTEGLFPSIFLLGEGERARIVAMASAGRRDQPLRTRVYDLALQLEREFVAGPAVAAMLEVTESNDLPPREEVDPPRPQFGPVGASPDRGLAFLVPGSLLSLGNDGQLSADPTVPFAGAGALSFAGTDDGWLVSGLGWNSLSASSAFLYGGSLGTRLVAVPREALAGSPQGDVPDLTLTDASIVDGAGGPVMYASGDGFRVDVRATPGAAVYAFAGHDTQVATSVGEAVSFDLQAAPQSGEASDAQVAEGVSHAGAPQQRAGIIVVEPGGITRVASWDAAVLDGAPRIDVAATTRTFESRATVTGNVEGPVTVTVDGSSVDVGRDGTFAVVLDAPIWGRDVRVRAVDPLGTDAVELVTVVGVIDLRGLPWLAIIGALTVALGALLFARIPSRPHLATVGDDRSDGVVEEVEEDPA